LLMILFSIFKSPLFLEYRWKADLVDLYILNTEQLMDLYHYEFKSHSSSQDSQESGRKKKIELNTSRILIGIQKIATDGLSRKLKVNKIMDEGFFLYFEYGEAPQNILYVLTATSDMQSHEYLLKLIKKKFQKTYKNLLVDVSIIKNLKENIFSNFSSIIEDIVK